MTDVKAKLRLRLALCLIPILFLLASMNLRAQQQTVRVAAAADLKFAMGELASQFENATGIRVDITTGSSGNFFAQIQNGAPFDLFFSADMGYPRRLEAESFTEPGTLCEYALGRIVIWAPASTEIDVAKQGWNVLLDSRVQKIAIANPLLAPYGRAAVSALQKAGLYDQVKNKLVYGENISQATQFVQSGNAQAGIIAYSLALSSGMKEGKLWKIPAEMYPPIEQGAVVLKAAKNKNAALGFLTFVRSSTGKTILEKYGFDEPVDEERRKSQ
ncbi:MAG TPA: molybdate ABC transporter substrate-binding protein [Candidatus Acidoferrum sp.]